MSNVDKTALVPKLRFPEFQGADEWALKCVEDYFNVGSSKRVLQQDWTTHGIPFYRTRELVSLSKGESFASEIFISEKLFSEITERYGAPKEGDFLVSGVGTLGISYLVRSKDKFYFKDGNVLWFEKRGAISSAYFKYCFESDLIQHQIVKQASVSTVGTYTIQNAKTTKLFVPPTAIEQQKIADCLSSLDELIAAQARKVDALKAHKRGLMQQLFPGEGETQPRLRFPEFQDAEKWEIRTIGDMFSLINGCAFRPEDWKPNGTPIIRIQNLNDPSAEFNYSQAPVSERNRVESGDLLFAWSGTLGSSFGARVWTGPPGVLNQHIFKVLMDEQRITLPFALLVLARVEEDIAEKSHGFKASFVHVKKSDLVKVELPLPALHEQQRIAACLSSLDALITAATQELDTLKTHKKGLMQQLFPSAGAVAA